MNEFYQHTLIDFTTRCKLVAVFLEIHEEFFSFLKDYTNIFLALTRDLKLIKKD